MAKVRVKCKGGTRTFKSKAGKRRYEAFKHIHIKTSGRKGKKK